jgi:hypothetical protein
VDLPLCLPCPARRGLCALTVRARRWRHCRKKPVRHRRCARMLHSGPLSPPFSVRPDAVDDDAPHHRHRRHSSALGCCRSVSIC